MPKNDAPAATKKSGGSGNNEQAPNTNATSAPAGANTPGQEVILTDIASSTGSTSNDAGASIQKPDDDSLAGADVVSLLGQLRGEIDGVPAIEVKATRDGFRRAGRDWSRSPTIVLMSDLSEEQCEMLAAEPNLTIRGIYVPLEADGE